VRHKMSAKACFSPDYKSDDGGKFDQSKVSNYFMWDTKNIPSYFRGTEEVFVTTLLTRECHESH